MSYFDCYLIPVPRTHLDAFQRFSARIAAIYKEHGAMRVIDCVLDPETGEGSHFHAEGARPALDGVLLPTFSDAAGVRDGELAVLSWTEWASKSVRDAALPRILADPRVQPVDGQEAIFEGSRMIAGGFQTLVDV